MPLGTDARAPKRAAPAAAARTIFPQETDSIYNLICSFIAFIADTLYGRRKDVQGSRHFYFLFYTIEQKRRRFSLEPAPLLCRNFLPVEPNKLRSNAHWVRSNAFFYGLLNGSDVRCLILDAVSSISKPLVYPAQIFHSFFIHLFHFMKLVKTD